MDAAVGLVLVATSDVPNFWHTINTNYRNFLEMLPRGSNKTALHEYRYK